MPLKICIFTIIVYFLFAATAQGQAPDTLWTRTFGGSEDDGGRSVIQTSDGGYIITGFTGSIGAGSYDVWLIKTDDSGNLEWEKTFGGSSSDVGHAVQQTDDGGFIICGYTYSGAGHFDVWLIKTDENGNLEWEKTFGGPYWDQGNSVQQTSDGGYIITGHISVEDGWDRKVYLVKTDDTGNLEWESIFGDYFGQVGYSVKQTADGGYIIAGDKGDMFSGICYLWLIKIDDSGNMEWDVTFGNGVNQAGGRSVIQTSEGGYVIAGMIDTYPPPYDWWFDAWLLKTDESGNLEWETKFGDEESDDYGMSMQQTFDGGYIIAGHAANYLTEYKDFYLVKTDDSGNMEWETTYDGSDEEKGCSVQQTSDGGFIIVGTTEVFLTDIRDVLLIKIEPPLGISEESFMSSGNLLISSVCPNPFSGITSINCTFPITSQVNISVYNLIGQRVEELDDRLIPAGEYSTTWNGTTDTGVEVPNGVYLVRVTSGNQEMTQKLVLVR